jgi:hypothetical protein
MAGWGSQGGAECAAIGHRSHVEHGNLAGFRESITRQSDKGSVEGTGPAS